MPFATRHVAPPCHPARNVGRPLPDIIRKGGVPSPLTTASPSSHAPDTDLRVMERHRKSARRTSASAAPRSTRSRAAARSPPSQTSNPGCATTASARCRTSRQTMQRPEGRPELRTPRRPLPLEGLPLQAQHQKLDRARTRTRAVFGDSTLETQRGQPGVRHDGCALSYSAYLHFLLGSRRYFTYGMILHASAYHRQSRVQSRTNATRSSSHALHPHRSAKTEFAGLLANWLPNRGAACPSAPSVLRALGFAAYHRSLKRVQSTFFQKFWMYFSLPHTP